MKISLKTIPHIANKIAIDLNKSGSVTMTQGLERVAQEAQKVFEEDVKKEIALEEKVDLICDDNEEEIEFQLVDERQLFFMIKKKLAIGHELTEDEMIAAMMTSPIKSDECKTASLDVEVTYDDLFKAHEVLIEQSQPLIDVKTSCFIAFFPEVDLEEIDDYVVFFNKDIENVEEYTQHYDWMIVSKDMPSNVLMMAYNEKKGNEYVK